VPVHDKLDEIITSVQNARAMPMSASCIVNRTELLTMLDELRELLPAEFRRAERVLENRDAVVDEGRVEAREILADALAERDRLLADTEVLAEATRRADEVESAARQEAAAMRREVDDYVDAKLAQMEVALHKILGAVQRGREKLQGRHELEELGAFQHDDSPLPG
jgi:hypothetical protein